MTTTSERETFLREKYFFYHEDGLLDIFVGLGIMMAGLSLWAGMVWMAGAWVAIFLPLWISARKSITYRRAADIRIPPVRSSRYFMAMVIGVVLVLVGVLVLVVFSLSSANLPSLRAWLAESIHLAVGLGLALVLMITAGVMRIARFVLYAGLVLVVFAVGQWLGWVFWVGMSVSGGLMALLGIAVLIRFIREHPLSAG